MMTTDAPQSRIIVKPGTTIYRRQRIRHQSGGSIAEIAGGTAAECTAVCCCCPCTVVNLVVLAVYKVPAGLCKKALRRRRLRHMMRRGLLRRQRPSREKHVGDGNDDDMCRCGGWDEEDLSLLSGVSENEEVTVVVMGGSEMDEEFIEFEKEMWDKFHTAGFWRSHSQKQLN